MTGNASLIPVSRSIRVIVVWPPFLDETNIPRFVATNVFFSPPSWGIRTAEPKRGGLGRAATPQKPTATASNTVVSTVVGTLHRCVVDSVIGAVWVKLGTGEVGAEGAIPLPFARQESISAAQAYTLERFWPGIR
ncbi:MAG: hypothetical protein ABI693_24315 [Bryobacteraceae bacterium]